MNETPTGRDVADATGDVLERTTIEVSAADIDLARLLIEMDRLDGRKTHPAVLAIAGAEPGVTPQKADRASEHAERHQHPDSTAGEGDEEDDRIEGYRAQRPRRSDIARKRNLTLERRISRLEAQLPDLRAQRDREKAAKYLREVRRLEHRVSSSRSSFGSSAGIRSRLTRLSSELSHITGASAKQRHRRSTLQQ